MSDEEEQDERKQVSLYVEDKVERTDSGKFAPGVSGNPKGRPKGRRNRITELNEDMELALREGANPEVVKAIIGSMAAEAMNGNVQAAKLILDKFMPNVKVVQEHGEDNPEIVIRIENLTSADVTVEPGQVIEHEESNG